MHAGCAPGDVAAEPARSGCPRSCPAPGPSSKAAPAGSGLRPAAGEPRGEDSEERSMLSMSCSSAAAAPNASGSRAPAPRPGSGAAAAEAASASCQPAASPPGAAAAAAAASQLLVLLCADGSAAAGRPGSLHGEALEDAGTDVSEVREWMEEAVLCTTLPGLLPCAGSCWRGTYSAAALAAAVAASAGSALSAAESACAAELRRICCMLCDNMLAWPTSCSGEPARGTSSALFLKHALVQHEC
jgi:hypothetical protein